MPVFYQSPRRLQPAILRRMARFTATLNTGASSGTGGDAPETAAPRARRLGIAPTSVCPGSIRTAMTARNRFAMPGLMDADRAAGIILGGAAAGRVRVAFPWWMALAVRSAGMLPPAVLAALMRGGSGKAAGPGLA